MTFGERLVEARKKAGLNQKQLAEALEITPTRLNYWEKDKREPDIFMIKKISSLLHISSDYLIGSIAEDYQEQKKSSSPFLAADERNFIKKYRVLSEHGKQMVNIVLDAEYEYSMKSRQSISVAARSGDTAEGYVDGTDEEL